MLRTHDKARRRLQRMRLAALFVAAAAASMMARQASPEPPDAPPQPTPTPVDALKPFGTSGKAVYPFNEGDKIEAELFAHQGKGCLTHMWFGGKWENYEKMRIRVYVDGEQTASIDMELFLGHGIGYQDAFGPWGTKRIGKTGQPSGIYNTYRIPFGKSIRVTAQLHQGDTGNKRFWYIIRGVENLPVKFSGIRLPESARLKLYKLEDYTAKTLEEFDLCNTSRPGMLYQVTIAAHSQRR